MLSLIMAGGEGTRLGMGEKPLVTICGRPMVSWVIDAFTATGLEVVVVASCRTPMTLNYLRAQGIPFYQAQGWGYVEDIVEAVTELGVRVPLFTSVADIPCLRPDHVKEIQEAYFIQERPALSTWIPQNLCQPAGCRTDYRESVNGMQAVPIGVNVLTGEQISEPQDEYRLLLHDPALARNVNTKEELDEVRKMLCREKD
ncbi:MAG: NTP transferase domain-containing protein [Methanomicrobiales archaeon]|nr:NTP transferase domain-containing protein [Methanomicrobiales archaeon]